MTYGGKILSKKNRSCVMYNIKNMVESHDILMVFLFTNLERPGAQIILWHR